MKKSLYLILLLQVFFSIRLFAQDNYEIQVYGASTMEPGETMIELHSNFTASGRKSMSQGLLPTHHAVHETLEITHGFSDWFETGFYIFTSARSGSSWQYVGSHIRPRIAAPARWKWPVGVGLSAEMGYQRPLFSLNTWTFELRPIIDKKFGRFYAAFNPTVDCALAGRNGPRGFGFSPNFKISYNASRKVAAGLEYYGSLGQLGNFDPLGEQQQQILPAIDLNIAPRWEINFGVGVGVTRGTDHLIVKAIVGRRFKW